MLLPQAREREQRFKLALRIGLPIFILFLIVSISFFSMEAEQIPNHFIITTIAVFGAMIYYIFYLIYQGEQEQITDGVTHTFTREYLINYFRKRILKDEYTIFLVSVQNLTDINTHYSVQQGDKVLYEVGQWIGDYLHEKGVEKFPIGHYKGSDFLIGLEGAKEQYQNILDLMCLKFENRTVDEIEVSFASAIVDNNYSQDLDQLITHLFDRVNEKNAFKQRLDEDEIDPTKLEASVINAIQTQHFSVMYQMVQEKGSDALLEASIKLLDEENKLIHQNKFIPIVKRLGLSRKYDEMILESITKQMQKIPYHLMVAIPLSPVTVRNNAFYEKADTLIRHNEHVSGRIIFILNEEEHYHQPRRYNDLLQAYRRMGIYIAMDNLGSYKSAMITLKELEVDIIRFDTLYGKNIQEQSIQNILMGLNVIVHNFKMRSWIRMVEDEIGMQFVNKIGIDFSQGKYLGKIAPLEAFIAQDEELK